MEAITIIFLIFGLINPTATLILGYLLSAIPQNNIPIVIEFIMVIFVPRLLITIYCFININEIFLGPLWVIIYSMLSIKDIIKDDYHGW